MEAQRRLVYFNGKLVPENEAKISIYDSALMFGDMVFEMTRSFNKKQFKLKEHIERLYAGVKILRIPLQMTPEEMERACYETIEANDHLFAENDEHRLMIDVSRGLLGIYQGIEGLHKGPNVIIADFPLRWTVASMGQLFETGINAVITSQRAIPASLLEPKIKTRSRIHYLMANIEASQIEGDNNWALLLDPDGFVAEGTGDNFFIVKNGVVITPEGRNVLRGVSRAYVMEELCSQLGIPVIEKNIDPYDVYTADEAFMTGTPFCMLPVVSLNGNVIGDGKVGEVFNKIIGRWTDNTGVDIIKQIKTWDAERVPTEAGSAPTPYRFKSK
jgi:branched-chain amino acid aminotransferase